jgi:alanine-synthesizing transaminase
VRPAPAWVRAALDDPAADVYRPEPLGLRSAREAVARYMAELGHPVTPEHVVLTASTSEAYGFLFKLLCEPGDEILVPTPSYPLLEHLCRLEGVRSRPYALAWDGRWHVTADALSAAGGTRTRAVIAVHPNNPTGSYLKREELALLAGLGLPLISDEVFAPYALSEDAERAGSALDAADSLVFTLHGLSKLVGLPQLKLSWLCVGGHEEVAREACARLEWIADTYLSVATPVQLALPELLARHGELGAPIRARLAVNLAQLRAQTQGSATTPLHVEGGFYAILRLPALRDDESWALELLERDAVLVQPGYFYDLPEGPFAVLSLLPDPAVFEEGLRRLLRRVSVVMDP